MILYKVKHVKLTIECKAYNVMTIVTVTSVTDATRVNLIVLYNEIKKTHGQTKRALVANLQARNPTRQARKEPQNEVLPIPSQKNRRSWRDYQV